MLPFILLFDMCLMYIICFMLLCIRRTVRQVDVHTVCFVFLCIFAPKFEALETARNVTASLY